MTKYPKKAANVISWALAAFFLFLSGNIPAIAQNSQNHISSENSSRLKVKIGNYFMYAPYGISMIANDATAFLIQPVFPGQPAWNGKKRDSRVAYLSPGITAPDFSYVRDTFKKDGANITFTWGKASNDEVVGMFQSDKPVNLTIALPAQTWPTFHAIYDEGKDGIKGYGITPQGKYIPFKLQFDQIPADIQVDLSPNAKVIVQVTPSDPIHFTATVGRKSISNLDDVAAILSNAKNQYENHHIKSSGDWGNFVSPIADNLNASRLYSSDNGRIAHIVGRGWWIGRNNPNIFPYFNWDSFFNGILSNLEDPKDARNTIRAVLSFQTPSGFIPLDSHWSDGGSYVTMDRSDPPIGAMAVWKMNQRWPDQSFLAEVYPHLVRWHEWWMKARDGNHDGLLEWGSQKDFKQGAMWETGWDDNVEYSRAHMVGSHLNADAVDLNALWSMDSEYLAKIARQLGKENDARHFEQEHKEMNKRINEHLWNNKLGMYCSRLWNVPKTVGPAISPQFIFKNGFHVTYYRTPILQDSVTGQTEYRIRHDWRNGGPVRGIPKNYWSAIWTGTFHPQKTGSYRFYVRANTGAKLYLNEKKVIDTWRVGHGQRRFADIRVKKGENIPMKLEYFDDKGPGSIRLTVHKLSPGKSGSDWLTRLTPMNFYPLAAGVPNARRAKKVLDHLYNKNTFWLHWLLPTVSKQDPVWPDQGYWHGNVWPPSNYLVWQGIKRYGDLKHQAVFARRSVALYMKDWKGKHLNGENYSSITGKVNGDPHYTWGALLPMIGVEAFTKTDNNDRPVARDNPYIKANIKMSHIPFGGKLYTILSRNGKVTVKEE